MQEIDNFFTFLPYCGDASQYMVMGEACAKEGECYNSLRPAATIYWFSLPFRMGLSPSVTLIGAHLLLTIISICLSVIAMYRLFQVRQASSPARMVTGLLFLIISAAIHTVFLTPVFRVPLSDVPANAFVLIAIWLLLINPSSNRARLITYCIVGLLLGLSTGIRIFFFYPVIFVLAVWLITWLANKNRKMVELAILAAFIPILSQFYTTWNHTAAISHIDPQSNNEMLAHHLDHNAIGLESIMKPNSETGYRWYSDCPYSDTLLNAIKNIDFHSINCVVSGRLNFYLGSYNRKIYIAVGDEQAGSPEINFGTIVDGGSHNASSNEITAEFRGKKISGSRMEAVDPALPAEIYKTFAASADENWYEISTALAIDDNHTGDSVDIIIRDHESKNIISRITHRLKPISQIDNLSQIDFRFHIRKSGLYDFIISLPPASSPDTAAGKKAIFYSWNFVNLKHKDIFIENAVQSNIRWWSSLLYWVNVVVFVVALITLLHELRKQYNSGHMLAYICVVLTCGQALLTLPEQRFFITPMITIWMFGVCSAIMWQFRKFKFI